MLQPRGSAIAVLILAAIGLRLTPYMLNLLGMPIDQAVTLYPWNFSPVLPLCLFGAAFYASRTHALLVPMLIYLAGDLGIWLITGRLDWALYAGQPMLYLSVRLVVARGFLLRGTHGWQRVAGTGLASAIVFFLVSNLGVWAFGGGDPYALNLSGLIDCYIQAIPFFRNTLISMVVFLPLLFSRLSLRELSQHGKARLAA